MVTYGTDQTHVQIPQFNLYSLSAQNAVAMSSNKRVLLYSGSSLLRVSPTEKENETIEAKEKTVNEKILECSKITENSLLGDAPSNVQGNETHVRYRKLSPRSRKKLFNRSYAFIRAQKVSRFPFITLSFINRVADKDGVKILNKFLTTIRKAMPEFEYLWVAERQMKNTKYVGNIHFHLICNRELDVKRYNYLWTLCQYNEGIVHENYSLSDIHKEYVLKGKIQKLLNPMDTKWANNINSVAAYLTKYISKNTDDFQCSVWHCSRNVSKLCTSMVIDRETWDEIGDKTKNNFTSKKTGKYYEVSDYQTDWAMVRSILNKQYYDKFLHDLHDLNHWILNGRDNTKIPNVKHLEFILFHLSDN